MLEELASTVTELRAEARANGLGQLTTREIQAIVATSRRSTHADIVIPRPSNESHH
jgi:hypothetical protein